MSVDSEKSNLWDERAKIFDKSVVQGEMDDKLLFEGWKGFLKEILSDDRKLRILDIGTGTGFMAITLAELGHDVSAIDVSPNMLEITRKRAAHRGLKIDFKLGDAMNLADFPPETFDVIINRYLTWALPDLNRAYEEWLRVISEEGRVIIIDGNWFKNRQSIFRKMWRSLAWILIYLTESRKSERDKSQELVSIKSSVSEMIRPEDDLKILNSCGYKVVKVTSNIYPLIYKGLQGKFEYLKRCYWGPAFMIIAEKSVDTRVLND